MSLEGRINMKLLRKRQAKFIVALVLLANLIFFYYTWKSTLWKQLSSRLTGAQDALVSKSVHDKIKSANKHIRKSITMVFTGFYNFENDIKASIDSVLNVIPNMPVLVLQESSVDYAYPPIVYECNATASDERTVRFMSLGFDVRKSRSDLNPLMAIHTKYALLMPDSVRLNNKNLLQKILREINSIANVAIGATGAGGVQTQRISILPEETVRRMIIVPFAGNLKSFSSCASIKLDLSNWTVIYTAVNASAGCDLFLQKHAILVDVDVLKAFPEPFALPFPELLYMQAKTAGITKMVFPQSFQEGRRLFASFHTKQRRMELRRRQFRDMYKRLQIKRIVRHSHKVSAKTLSRESNNIGSGQHNIILEPQFSSSNFSLPLLTEIDLIGCERTTKSCIGAVYGNRPFYTYLDKHTPPCCLDKLKTTFGHVLEEFENVGIRYWLDNYSLKSAIDTNQLSPDAYDIDISFNVQDLERSNAMKKSQSKPFVDNEGFYWIKATDGYYFRVQFSKVNQVGVNLLPFDINGNEVQANGFFGWKAQKFSVDFLHPMSTVLFMGKNIPCPNNVLEYLEFKKIK